MRMIDEKRLVKEIKNWIKTDRFEDYSAGYILSDIIEEINKMPKAANKHSKKRELRCYEASCCVDSCPLLF